jgi:hypothetical protein
MMTMTKQHCQNDVKDDGNNGNGRDRDSNGNGNGDGDNATTAANGNDVNDDDMGVSRTAIGQRQLDDNNGMTTM